MAWAALGTAFTPNNQWQFTDTVKGEFFRLKHTRPPNNPKAWICQAEKLEDGSYQTYNIQSIKADNPTETFKLVKPPIFTNRCIGIRYDVDYKSAWSINLEVSTSEQPFIPNLLSNLALWWNASNVIKSATSKISQLIDLSSNEISAIQSLEALQPLFIDNAINNNPVIRFSGSQYFTHSYLGEVGTMIAVTKAIGNGHQTLAGAKSDRPDFGAYYFKTNDPNNKMSVSRLSLGQASANNKLNSWYIQSARFTNSTNELFVNSNLVATSSKSGQAILIKEIAALGAGYYNNNIVDIFAGDLGEFLITSQPLNDDDLIKTINYYKAKYNLTN